MPCTKSPRLVLQAQCHAHTAITTTTTTLPRTRTHARTHTHTHTAKVGASVAIKIEATNDEQTHLLYGRHFDHKKPLYSQISRQGVAALKVGHFTVLVHACKSSSPLTFPAARKTLRMRWERRIGGCLQR